MVECLNIRKDLYILGKGLDIASWPFVFLINFMLIINPAYAVKLITPGFLDGNIEIIIGYPWL